MTDLLLTSLALATLGISVLVVTAPSPVISVLWLVALFMSSAGYMIVAGAPFVGLVYLVVYVGAVAVLFLFVILMLNVPLSAYGTADQVRSLPLVATLGGLFLLTFLTLGEETVAEASSGTAPVGLNQAHTLASDLFTHGAFLLILVGVILLLAMIGPVSLSMDHDTEELNRIKQSR
jgi:NADH:ubiquinone oxidoreductase subunit 6 (subunit J)